MDVKLPASDEARGDFKRGEDAYSRNSRRGDREAARWFRKAAEQGHAGAQDKLGGMYYIGHGFMEDHTEAARWFRKAAEQGYAEAQHMLGDMYSSGMGLMKDYAEAATWWQKAAEQGHAGAQYKLGVIYNCGEGVVQDDTEAVRWFRKAAEQGDTDAQSKLGAMYHAGAGVAQDHVAAYMWLDIAMSTAALGPDEYLAEEVREMRDIVEAEMTPTDISEAQRRARICLESNYQQCD